MRHTDSSRHLLNKKFLENLTPPAKGRRYYYDQRTPGLRIQITQTGTRSWQVYRWHQGRPVTITLGRWPAMSAADARRAAARVLADLAEGRHDRGRESARITVREAMDAYLGNRDLKPRTREDVPATLRWGIPDWLDRPLPRISPDAVERRYQRLCERSVSGANRTMRYLRAIYNYMRGRDPGLSNPVLRLTLTRSWRRVERRQTVIRAHELRGWWEAVGELPSQTHTDYFRFVLLTGLRRGEALGLTWADIDFEGRILEVADTKARRPHALPLTAYLTEMLERRRAVGNGSDYIFADHRGRRISNFRYAQDAVERACGVRFRIHDLRRTFATIGEALAIPPYTLKRLLNHSVAGDVTAGYIISEIERLREPMELIGRRILRLAGVGEETEEEIPEEELEAARALLRRAGYL